MNRLNNTEREIFRDLLDRLDDHFATAGCNDYDIPDTPEARAVVREAEAEDGECDCEPIVQGGKIYTQDFILLAYIRRRVGLD